MAATPRPNSQKPWTPEEAATLRRLAEARCSPRDIAEQLGRSILAVASQAGKLKVKLGQTNVERAVERAAARAAVRGNKA